MKSISLSLIFFVAFVATVWADLSLLNDEQKALAKSYGESCMRELNVNEDDRRKFRLKDFANPSEELKCFANCFFEKTGTLKDGAVQEEVVLRKMGGLIGEEKAKKIMAKCNGVKGENNCDTAFKLYECYEQTKAEMEKM